MYSLAIQITSALEQQNFATKLLEIAQRIRHLPCLWLTRLQFPAPYMIFGVRARNKLRTLLYMTLKLVHIYIWICIRMALELLFKWMVLYPVCQGSRIGLGLGRYLILLYKIHTLLFFSVILGSLRKSFRARVSSSGRATLSLGFDTAQRSSLTYQTPQIPPSSKLYITVTTTSVCQNKCILQI